MPFLCIQQAYQAAPDYFHGLYSTLGSAGHQPQCWRLATTVIIPKPNKPDYTNPKAYRPVALLNCLGKLLEKLMASRLAHLAEAHNLLHEDQIGGGRQRSAIDAAMAFTHEIDRAKHHKEIVSVLLMDIRGAFDNVAKTRLLNTMRHVTPAVRSLGTHAINA
jgi:hypothetical protein